MDEKIQEMLKKISENMLTRKDIEDVASEIVEKKLVESAERGITFPADGTQPDSTHKTFTPKTSFTADEQKKLDEIYLYKTLLGLDTALASPWVAQTLSQIHGISVKAQDTTSLSPLIPTGLSPQLEDEIQLRLLVAPQFREVRQPTNPYTLPIKTSRATAYLVGENAAITDSSVGTGLVTLDLEKLAVLTSFSYEVEADSLVPVLGMLRDDIVNVLARQIDDNVINGTDTPATGQTAVYGSWDGLKKYCTTYSTVASAGQASVFSTTDVMTMRNTMKIRGLRTDDLVLFVSTTSYNDLLKDSNVITVDKFGPNATVIRGQVAQVFGVPIVASEFVDTTSANQGNTLGLARTKDMILASRSGFVMGRPQTTGVLVETFRDITTQTTKLAASIRRDFQTMVTGATSANPAAAQVYHKV